MNSFDYVPWVDGANPTRPSEPKLSKPGIVLTASIIKSVTQESSEGSKHAYSYDK